MEQLKKMVKSVLPYALVKLIQELKGYEYSFYPDYKKQKIRDYFLRLNYEQLDIETKMIADYLRHHFLDEIFPYEWTRKYKINDTKTFYDYSCKMGYILYNGKRLYFPKNYNSDQIKKHAYMLLLDQDKESPHCYVQDGFIPQKGNIIADIGAAEGIWALNNAENASKIYLFECNKCWVEALKQTFKPYKEKVQIVNKFVGAKTSRNYVSLDDFLNGKKLDVVKADIEGAEVDLVKGAKNTLAGNDLKLLLCTYHKEGDAESLQILLEQAQYETSFTRGYMIFYIDKDFHIDNTPPPYPSIPRCLRRGLILANRIKKE